jgi:hypothetical protein
VPSRSIFFFKRRRALSTGSPFFNLISVKNSHFLPGFADGPHDRRLKWLTTMLPPRRYVNGQNTRVETTPISYYNYKQKHWMGASGL